MKYPFLTLGAILATHISRRLFSLIAFSAGLALSAGATTPAAVWGGDFNTATKGGWTLSLKDGTALPTTAGNLALSANVLKLTSANTSTQYMNGAIVVRYSGYAANGSKNHTALSAVCVSSGSESGCEANGGILKSYSNTDVGRPLDKAIGLYSTNNVAIPSSGYMILAYNVSMGMAAFFADSNKAEWKGGYNSGIVWSGKTVDGFAVGGTWRDAPVDTMGPCATMTIEAVAVFENYNGLDQSGIEGLMAYEFPLASDEELISVVNADGTDAGAIKLKSDWVAEKTGETDPQKQAVALNTKQANNQMMWENAVLGLDGTKEESGPVVAPVQTADANSITFKLGGCNVDAASGATVTYKVYGSTDGSSWSAASGETAHDATVSVDLPSSGVKYYKFEVSIQTSR